jgi:hypothetical protein
MKQAHYLPFISTLKVDAGLNFNFKSETDEYHPTLLKTSYLPSTYHI